MELIDTGQVDWVDFVNIAAGGCQRIEDGLFKPAMAIVHNQFFVRAH